MYAKYKLTNIFKNDIENQCVFDKCLYYRALIRQNLKTHRSKSTNFFLEILERTAHAWLQIINHFDYVYYIPLKQFINNNKRISYILAWFLNTQSTKTFFYSCSQITKKYELSDLAQKVKWTCVFLNGIILLNLTWTQVWSIHVTSNRNIYHYSSGSCNIFKIFL